MVGVRVARGRAVPLARKRVDTARAAIDSGSPVVCPDAEELAALLSHALDPDRRAVIVDHAATCSNCHALVSELAGPLETVGDVDPHADTRSPEDAAAPVRRMIADALRTHERRSRIGRYHLLEVVGAGGMGIVWGAWDPQLARRVALKLVHPRIESARDRILAEGQALGKLSHPNVVPVYDVGIVDEQVYLVMEWVQGTTLRAYAASPCSQRDIIDAYRQAGEGLAAAHRAGLIHRDFKPDNAIRGDDGRVRVLDFGLARSDDESADPVKRLAGTPRYMAPEQAAGAALTAAADQYAFALSLREALTRSVGGRSFEVPSWLTGVLARGTAREPADRFASMADLLRALARDPARVWRRRGIAIAALSTAAMAFALGRSHTEAAPTCVGSTAEIARSWNPAVRAAMAGHLRTLGEFAAGQADRLGDELDRYSAAWAVAHRGACLAHERGELPTTLYERRLSCLARGQAALTTVAELMTSVTGDPTGALRAARSLPTASGCVAADTSTVPPPSEAIAAPVATVAAAVERARLLAVAERADAATVAQASVTAADQLGYEPLIARALVVQGRAEAALNVGEAGEIPGRKSLERAVDLALRSGDDVLAVEAYARLVWAVGRYKADVVDGWSVVEAIAARTGSLGRFGRVLLYNNKATAQLAAGNRTGARAMLERALAASPAEWPSEDELEMISVPRNLVLVVDDPVDREARSRQVIERFEAMLGTFHPDTLGARLLAANLTRNRAAAMVGLDAACDGFRRYHPQRTRRIVDCVYEQAWLADDRGDTAAAITAMKIAATDTVHQRLRGKIAASYLKIAGTGSREDAPPVDDDVLAAVTAIERDAQAFGKTAELWNRSEAADAYLTAALGWDRLAKPRDAERCWTAALALFEGVQQPIYERRLARVRATLARRWHQARPDDARTQAMAALAWYRDAGGYEAEIAELSAIAGAR
jgi:eukaryotic-like serine/threonine-protein kinase